MSPQTATPAPQTPEIKYLNVDDLVPYEFNPRDNTEAIAAVKNSIREFGFLVPFVVDEDNILVAGHTRHAALKELIAEEPHRAEYLQTVPCMVASGLTDDQIRAFRLIDNKTAEIAGWDFNLLANEISALSESGIPFIEFGWSQEEVDCLTAVVNSDCLTDSDIAQAMSGEAGGFNPAGGAEGAAFRAKDGSIRINFGDLGFFVLEEDYRRWLDEMMKIADYDPERLVLDVAEKMGLLSAKLRRDQHIADALGAASIAPEEQDATDATSETIPQ